MRLVRRIVDQLQNVIFARLLRMSDEGLVAIIYDSDDYYFGHQTIAFFNANSRTEERQPKGVGRYHHQHGVFASVWFTSLSIAPPTAGEGGGA